MSREHQRADQKSLRLITGKTADWPALAATCVCFASASGGGLRIGIEDGEDLPPAEQRIVPELLDQVRKRVAELSVNVQVAPEIVQADNGAEYLLLTVARSVGVASTTDGRYFIRVGDECRPIVGDEVLQLLNDRPSMPWETLISLQVPAVDADAQKLAEVLAQLRASDRVKDSVKEKNNAELLGHYGLSDVKNDGSWLTNLGVLVVGQTRDRARLGSAPNVQAIKYDELGQKVNKWVWDDYTLSPLELIDAIWRDIPDFHESYELPDGLYRQKLPAYDRRVVRELLVNALVHRPYTHRGDLYLNLHPDRLEVVNPGRLPLGVTPRTMLHESRRRNDRLATLFHDLRLMEKEGSGFDLMYDVQLSQGRPVPVAKEGADRVSVTVGRRVQRPEVVKLMSEADNRFQLRQRERITLGLLAASADGLTARELALNLELPDTDALRPAWLGRLLELGLVESAGRTQGTRYFVSPALLKGAGLDAKTTLKRMEPHRLRALILEDLSRYPGSSSGDINRRVGPEVPYRSLKRALDDLVAAGSVRFEGDGRGRKYWPASKP